MTCQNRSISDDIFLSSYYNNATTISSATTLSTVRSLSVLKTVFYVYISPVIISVGIFGDLMSIVVLSHPFLRKSSVVYTYLLILAFTDMLAHFSVIPMVLWIMDIKSCGQWAAFYYAHLGFPLANAFMGASVWIVVFITLGQYIAVCHPFLQTFRSKRMCLCLTALAYALSFSIYAPWCWRKTVVKRQPKHQCYPNANGHGTTAATTVSCQYLAVDDVSVISAPWYQIYQWTRESISRFVPFLFIFYFNARILYTYRVSKKRRMDTIGEFQKRQLQIKHESEERRLWYLLLTIMVIFFVCTLPAAPLTILVSDKNVQNLTFQLVRALSNLLEFTKFALNFYFYCMINPDIRRLFVKRLQFFCQYCNRMGRWRTDPGAESRNKSASTATAQMLRRQYSKASAVRVPVVYGYGRGSRAGAGGSYQLKVLLRAESAGNFKACGTGSTKAVAGGTPGGNGTKKYRPSSSVKATDNLLASDSGNTTNTHNYGTSPATVIRNTASVHHNSRGNRVAGASSRGFLLTDSETNPLPPNINFNNNCTDDFDNSCGSAVSLPVPSIVYTAIGTGTATATANNPHRTLAYTRLDRQQEFRRCSSDDGEL